MPNTRLGPRLCAPSQPQDQLGSAGEARRLDPTHPKAFLIDDEQGICKFISAVLNTLGLTADSFHTAQEVVAALKGDTPDIVFLDIALGGSDAIDVIRALGQRRYAGVVQLMSGAKSALLDDVHRIGTSHGLNMRPPLEKPFRKEAIQRAIANLSTDSRPHIAIAPVPSLHPGLDVALAKGWLELWYQPKFDLRTMALVGAEGIVRYRHPIHGDRDIDGLLPQTGTETRAALTEHLVLTALHDWNDLDHAGFNTRIALKASFDALAKLDLAALAREHRPGSQHWPGLILQISEQEIIEDFNLAHEVATQLRIYDITLSIDNFGAGFSSFERLRELPFTELRVHAGFVAGCGVDAKNAGICRAAIDLAHRFDIVAVADGLASSADMRALRRMGCDVAQGSILANPMPKPQFIPTLRHRASTRTNSSASTLAYDQTSQLQKSVVPKA